MSHDGHLLKRLNRGDFDALERIYEKYVDHLVVVAMSLLGDVHEAEDCLHDVFKRLAQAAGQNRIRQNLRAYLATSVANSARDRLRRKAARPLALTGEPEAQMASANPVVELIEAERSERLFRAISQLPYEQRETFLLHVQGEMKFRQIAGIVGVSVNTVKSRYRYAIEKIRTLLRKEIENE
jgi:RNA polymerase sigma-70 factor (ECF subfamily)